VNDREPPGLGPYIVVFAILGMFGWIVALTFLVRWLIRL
jgi:hypothetical protein